MLKLVHNLKNTKIEKSSVWIFAVFTIIAIAYVFLAFSANMRMVLGSDFLSYFVGATLVKDGNGDALYSVDENFSAQKTILRTNSWKEQDRVLEIDTWRNTNTYRSLPFVATFFLPLTYFSVLPAFKIFMLFNLILALFFIKTLYKLFVQIKKNNPYFFLAPLVYVPVILNLQAGQTALVLAIFLLLVYKFLKEKRDFLAGVFSALLILKIQYIIFALFFFILSKSRQRFTSGFLVTVFLLLFISISVSGTGSILHYPQFLLATENSDFGSSLKDMFTLYAFLVNFPIFQIIHARFALIINGLVYLLAIILFIGNSRKVGFNRLFVSATLFSVTLCLHLLPHDLTLLLIPIFILLNSVSKKKGLEINFDFFVIFFLFMFPSLIFTKTIFYSQIILLIFAFYFLFAGKKNDFDFG